MSGVTGMHRLNWDKNLVRNQIWQSIRILRRFTLPDVCRTIPEGGEYQNVKKYVGHLFRHGYVAKVPGYTGGRSGRFQIYTLTKDSGPEYPAICAVCKKRTTVKKCASVSEETNKERKKETNAVRPTEQGHNGATS